MAIVARLARSLVAVVLGLWLASCSPAPSATPSSPSSSPGSTATSAETSSACQNPTEDSPDPANESTQRVFYEVFVRSFSDSDGDGIGDLAGLTSKLDYLNDGDPATTGDLGITGIWLMPVAEAASYHGYDVTDYTAVEHDYGDGASLRAFINAAHARGISVIVDFVINHTSRDHPWFRDALAGGKHRDWYVWSETDPGWPPVAGPSPWHETPAGDFYYGAFWEGMPDLNLRNPDVTAEIERIANVWLDDYGVDGFRIDAAKHLIENGPQGQADTPETRQWLETFTTDVHQEHPGSLVVGEVYDSTRVSSAYVPLAADATFAFELAGKTLLGIQAEDGPTIAAALDETRRSYAGGAYGAFLTNHDQPRVATQLPSSGAARVAASLLLTGPGIPFVYYGEELGLTGGKPDERIRSPMPWTASGTAAGFTSGVPWEPLEPGHDVRNVEAESANPTSLLEHYRRLIAMRRSHEWLNDAEIYPLTSSATAAYAFLAAHGDRATIVVTNLASDPLPDLRLSLAAGPCGLSAASVVYADGLGPAEVQLPTMTATGGLDAWRPAATMPPYSTIVIDLGGVSP